MVSAEEGGRPPDSTGARRAAARLGDGRSEEVRRVGWAGGRGSTVRGPAVRGSAVRGSGVRGSGVRGCTARGSAVRGSVTRGSTADAPEGSAGPGDSGSVGMLLLPLPWRTAPTVRPGRVAV